MTHFWKTEKPLLSNTHRRRMNGKEMSNEIDFHINVLWINAIHQVSAFIPVLVTTHSHPPLPIFKYPYPVLQQNEKRGLRQCNVEVVMPANILASLCFSSNKESNNIIGHKWYCQIKSQIPQSQKGDRPEAVGVSRGSSVLDKGWWRSVPAMFV